ncbi:general stress protein [Streptomyces sp. NPDC006624]|uniref:general stress protein n=1 Tax=unclassified Streptomyces TaxID=2593676 RepID=UPI0033A55B9B
MTEQPRRPVAAYETYREAERAVDHLSDQGFPMERVAIVGAIAGALFGLLPYALRGGRRDFASLRSMEPSRYDGVVDEAVADEAVRLLGGPQTTNVGGPPART